MLNAVLAGVLVVMTAATAPTLPSTVACEAHMLTRVLGELIGWQVYWVAVVTVVEWLHPKALTVPTAVCAVMATVLGAIVPVIAALAAFRALG